MDAPNGRCRGSTKLGVVDDDAGSDVEDDDEECELEQQDGEDGDDVDDETPITTKLKNK